MSQPAFRISFCTFRRGIAGIRTELSCRGQVVALGTRVVEIPERLRKMPEIKTYGREILVAIPPANEFLQKEKVQLFLESRD
ncbi:MAG TPA: hypothetical protein P5563_00425 [Saprospiraceae bacterium]|nr:hypothetical protein [Saprospiraceae bacterium]